MFDAVVGRLQRQQGANNHDFTLIFFCCVCAVCVASLLCMYTGIYQIGEFFTFIVGLPGETRRLPIVQKKIFSQLNDYRLNISKFSCFPLRALSLVFHVNFFFVNG